MEVVIYPGTFQEGVREVGSPGGLASGAYTRMTCALFHCTSSVLTIQRAYLLLPDILHINYIIPKPTLLLRHLTSLYPGPRPSSQNSILPPSWSVFTAVEAPGLSGSVLISLSFSPHSCYISQSLLICWENGFSALPTVTTTIISGSYVRFPALLHLAQPPSYYFPRAGMTKYHKLVLG